MPGVTAVARISGLPLGPSENVASFTRPDQPPPPPGQGPSALYRVVDAEYFDTMQIPVLAGRAFLPTDRAGAQPVVIISRRMADIFWPGEDPVGRPIQIRRGPPADRRRRRRQRAVAGAGRWRSRRCTCRTRRPTCAA